MLQYVIAILLSVTGMLYCVELESFKEKIKKPYPWFFFAAMITISTLTAFYYEQPGNFIGFCVAQIFLLMCVYVDIESGIIPNKLLLFFLLIGLITLPFNPSVSWKEASIGFVAIVAIFGAISVISKGALGMGDVKLMAVMGLILGWKMFLTVILIAILASVITGIFLLIVKRKKRDARIAFTPFILIGTIICILL